MQRLNNTDSSLANSIERALEMIQMSTVGKQTLLSIVIGGELLAHQIESLRSSLGLGSFA